MHRIVAGLAAAATVPASLSLPESAQAASPCGEPAERPWCKTSLSADRRAALLLKAMTVDERIELLAADDPAWKIAPGCYRVMVGDSSRTIALNGLLRPWRSRLPPLISAIVTHPVIFHLIRRRVLSHTHPPTRYK